MPLEGLFASVPVSVKSVSGVVSSSEIQSDRTTAIQQLVALAGAPSALKGQATLVQCPANRSGVTTAAIRPCPHPAWATD